VIWLDLLLAKFSNGEAEQVMRKVDNKSAISLANNPSSTSDPSKYFKYHFIRGCMEKEDRAEVCANQTLARRHADQALWLSLPRRAALTHRHGGELAKT
jgi:hypothetical protein